MVSITLHDYYDFSCTGDLQSGGGGSDTLTGSSCSDILAGGKGNDRLEGGQGDDLLIGGGLKVMTGQNAGEYTSDAAGEDTFVFNFQLNHSEGTTYYFRPNADGTGGDTPGINANKQAWDNYVSQLAAWRAEMVLTNGVVDQDQSKAVNAQYTVKNGGTKSIESLGQFDNSFTTAGSGWTIAEHDGNDTIAKWGDGDKLELKGLAQIKDLADFDTLFDVALNAKGDTVLSWDGGSITIHGMAIASVDAFWTAGGTNGWFA